MSKVKLEDIVSLAKRRGFIYQGSEIYGGLAGTWDYGPLGVTLKRNIMNLWWKTFVEDRDDMYGVDAAILMNKKVWEASGHADTFIDPLIQCSHCNARFRVDHLVSDKKDYEQRAIGYFRESIETLSELPDKRAGYNDQQYEILGDIFGEARVPAYDTSEETIDYLKRSSKLYKTFLGTFPYLYLTQVQKKCEKCGSVEWGEARTFNMMFRTYIGPVDTLTTHYASNIPSRGTSEATSIHYNPAQDSNLVYLRPETAQGMFTNYKNIMDSFYPDLPFGIAQQGKAFRNEISPRDFVFRSREFEQMEIEYFVNPSEWKKAFEQWVKNIEAFLKDLGLPAERVHKLEVPEADRAHYSQRTIDFEFDFPIGKEELLGLAYRTDFDLKNIEKVTGKSVEYRPKDESKPFVPHVIEPSFGVERLIMAVLTSAYTEDEVNGEKRVYLKLPAELAPVKVAVSPLLKNKPELAKKAREVYDTLKKEFGNVMWDDNGNIGKRYRRQDEIGTPYCVVIDFDSLEDDTVTVRDRDTTKQARKSISELADSLR